MSEPFGTLSAAPPPSSGRDYLAGLLRNYVLPRGTGFQDAANIMGTDDATTPLGLGMADLTPLGIPLAADDAWGNIKEGNYGSAALDALGMIPGGALAAKVGGKAMPAVKRMLGFGDDVPSFDPMAKLPGAPSHIDGPVPAVVDAAQKYASDRGIDLQRQSNYAVADPRRGKYIADAYHKMKHDPADPRAQHSYQALADETMAQWHALQEAGAKIDFMPPGMADPYPGGPREALADLRENHHLWVLPSDEGFGSINEIADNPLLADTGIVHGGHPMKVNDAFRAVHDYFGHGMEGANFGARGEENAWQAHRRLFSPDAIPAMTSETRGQNSWVNFGPFGERNRANQRDTVFADQKTGLLPEWALDEKGMPLSYRAGQAGVGAGLGAAALLGGSTRREE